MTELLEHLSNAVTIVVLPCILYHLAKPCDFGEVHAIDCDMDEDCSGECAH